MPLLQRSAPQLPASLPSLAPPVESRSVHEHATTRCHAAPTVSTLNTAKQLTMLKVEHTDWRADYHAVTVPSLAILSDRPEQRVTSSECLDGIQPWLRPTCVSPFA